MSKQLLTAEEVRVILRNACKQAGGQRAWAEAHKIVQPTVSYALSGNRPLYAPLLKKLGLRKVTRYERI